MEILFWVLLFVIAESYFFYPLIIIFLNKLRRKIIHKDYFPDITILISAYNEEKDIENRINNIAALDYPLEKIEVIVGSDFSSDNTGCILKNLESKFPWLRVYIFSERRGKAGVLNELAGYAGNQILVFTDANTEFDKSALKKLVWPFCYSEIGGVSGRLILNENEHNVEVSNEEKKYWDFETHIKRSEGELGILIGANGGIFALRKKLYTPIPVEKAVTDDFFLSLHVLLAGSKFYYCFDSFATEDVCKEVGSEIKRKIRFAATNFQTISFFKKLLFNKNVLLSFAFWSHKIFRWFTPFLLVFIYLLNLIIIGQGIVYHVLLLLQAVFYISASVGAVLSKYNKRIILFSIPFYFVMTNIAFFAGYFRFINKKHSVIWQSTPR
jgi:cellulose synthase/poly-beta-1,6-N-acetylglucosamine synthase-like glycosyltransferase